MKIVETPIKGAFSLNPQTKTDNRGYLYRWFCKKEFSSSGIAVGEIVQANHSYNKNKGTFRGLHFQSPLYAEEKIVKCLKGLVLDFIVDLRKGSETFLKSYSVELSERNHRSILIPKGCAHGFITLSNDCELVYLHTEYYHVEHEIGISVFDPALNIKLPIKIREISERDKNHPLLSREFMGFEI